MKNRSIRGRAVSGLFCLLIATGASQAPACNVPVFRYALERWPADLYEVTLFHRGPLSAADQAVANAMREASDTYAANFTLTAVDLPGPTNFALPALVVNFPPEAQVAGSAWRGPFSPATSRLLLDSPARRELVRRLVSGDSTVWLLLDGNEEAARLLDTELRRLEKEITVPEVDPDDPRTDNNVDLKIAFSVLHVRRADPAEELFVAMLLNTDPALANAMGPIAFPVYGRGRILCALSGSTLTRANIESASIFMCGACSCEVKAQNAGVDLLLSADWDTAIEERTVVDPPLPPLVSLSTLAGTPASPDAPVAAPPASVAPGRLWRNLGLALALLVAAAIFGTWRMKGRHRA